MEESYEGTGPRIRLHDVSPYTWESCVEWIDLCASLGLPPLDLLVVPRHQGGPSDRGAGLPPEFVKRLKALRAAGHPLWIHGWTHQGGGGEGEFRRMDPIQVADRARRALLDWKAAGLPDPDGFCPPRWEMPSSALPALFQLGFRKVDLRLGVAYPGTMRWSPVLSSWGGRGWLAGAWDRSLPFQKRLLSAFPIRVALHPQDLAGPARKPMEKVLAALL